MINTSKLRAQFKAVRTEQKTSESIGEMVLVTLIIVLGAAAVALLTRGVCLAIVAIQHATK